jgi:uncharacterized 2Fe-2S/4Fe-4S cluster protein (DUF4445 family)
MIAGGFGKHVNLDAAIDIGLIPKQCKENTVFVGNSSLAGCVSWLTHEKAVPSKQDIDSIQVIELAKLVKSGWNCLVNICCLREETYDNS